MRSLTLLLRGWLVLAGIALAVLSINGTALAGGQRVEPLSNSVKALMQRSISDSAAPRLVFASAEEGTLWMTAMSQRLKSRMPDDRMREDFLRTVNYEAARAGLDPQLVLALIQVESAFKKYAVSSVGARGFMQVMPFWVKSIGNSEHNLFHMRLNLRYGCTILRHYLDIESGDLYRALGRYNGSLGQPQYPNLVVNAWKKNWTYQTPLRPVSASQ